jgi:hypothetical protein
MSVANIGERVHGEIMSRHMTESARMNNVIEYKAFEDKEKFHMHKGNSGLCRDRAIVTR